MPPFKMVKIKVAIMYGRILASVIGKIGIINECVGAVDGSKDQYEKEDGSRRKRDDWCIRIHRRSYIAF